MTVSPERPPDGNRPFAGSQAEKDDGLLTPALPPTLFALPNLKTPVGNDAASQPVPNPDPNTPSNPLVSPDATPVEPVMREPTVAQPANVPPTRTATAPDTRPTDDAPAGRGWMEKIGAHSLVLLMLVIVIAAALATGRKQSDAPNANADSMVADLEDIDVGVASAELPIPTHAASAVLDPPAKSDSEAISESKLDESSVSIAANSSVEASPASTRNYTEAMKTPIDSGPLTAEPALAASAEPVAASEPVAAPEADESGPRLSKTPAWISDLSQYLPAASNQTSPAASTGDAPTPEANATTSP